MPRFERGREQFERRTDLGLWEIVRVTFDYANVDQAISHHIETPDPEQVTYQLLNATGPMVLYHDGSPSRTPWNHGFCRLRSSTGGVTCDILLGIPTADYGTTHIPLDTGEALSGGGGGLSGSSLVPLSTGEEPLTFVSDGAGSPVFVSYTP